MTTDSSNSRGLQIGAAEVDITPWSDVQVAGAVRVRRKAKAVLDPLFAKALVLDNGKTRLCLVSGDLTIVTRPASDRIRDLGAEKYNFDRDAIIIHMTQTHTAPGLGHFMLDEDFTNIPDEYSWVRGGDERYTEFAIEKMVEVIGQAAGNLQPVDVGVTSALEGRLAFNRRGVRKDGTVGMPPKTWTDSKGPDWITFIEGPIDPQMLMMCFRTADLKIPAAMLHYSCHPVCVFPRQLISSDWPGTWSDGIRRLFGPECTPLVVNGCCGNLNPWGSWDPNHSPDHRRMGGTLAKRCEDAMEWIEFSDTDTLDYRSVHLKIPYRKVPDEMVAESKKYLAENPEIIWADQHYAKMDPGNTIVDPQWFRHANIMSLYLEQKREVTMDYEIQVWRIGDSAVVTMPGEPFVEGQLQIKQDSPAKFTFVMHMTSHYVGYVPTLDAIKRPGHETTLSTWSKLVPQALDMIVESATAILKELFPS